MAEIIQMTPGRHAASSNGSKACRDPGVMPAQIALPAMGSIELTDELRMLLAGATAMGELHGRQAEAVPSWRWGFACGVLCSVLVACLVMAARGLLS